MSVFHSTVSRRDFMKICGFGGIGAAALTYVAGMVSAVLNLLYLVSMARNRNS